MIMAMQYIGARYVPIIYTNPDDGSAKWKANVFYEALTIVVEDDGDSYTSKKAVPANIGKPSENPVYWVKTGDFNASLLALQREVQVIDNDINNETTGLKVRVNGLDNDINNETTGLKVRVENIENQNGDSTLATDAQTLSDAINELFAKKPSIYNTLADVIADEKLEDGMIVYTKGYAAVDDDGNAFYDIVSSSDGELCIQLNNELYAKLNVINGILNVRQIGANETGDNVAVFNLALDIYEHYDNVTTIYFPTGEYKFATPIQMCRKNNLRIVGDGWEDTIFTYTGAEIAGGIDEVHDAPFYLNCSYEAAAESPYHGNAIEGIQFKSDAKVPAVLTLNCPTYSQFKNILINAKGAGTTCGAYIGSCQQCNFFNFGISANLIGGIDGMNHDVTYGVVVGMGKRYSGSGYGRPTNNYFEQLRAEEVYIGILLQYCDSGTFKNIAAEYNTYRNMIVSDNTRGCLFSGVDSEGFPNTIYFPSDCGILFGGIHHIIMNSGDTAKFVLNGNRCTVMNCLFDELKIQKDYNAIINSSFGHNGGSLTYTDYNMVNNKIINLYDEHNSEYYAPFLRRSITLDANHEFKNPTTGAILVYASNTLSANEVSIVDGGNVFKVGDAPFILPAGAVMKVDAGSALSFSYTPMRII